MALASSNPVSKPHDLGSVKSFLTNLIVPVGLAKRMPQKKIDAVDVEKRQKKIDAVDVEKRQKKIDAVDVEKRQKKIDAVDVEKRQNTTKPTQNIG
jgi:hypothetical protein